ncbi:MAG: hypothetical protein RLZZ515_436 [Cyanobacteriota bacterium]|jgi:methylase of polypeptide subunit release factors
MDEPLTAEQQYMLRRLELEARQMSREELIKALCASWEAKYRQLQFFTYSSRSAGFLFRIEERHPWQQPETEQEFKDILGYVPTEAEAQQYIKEAWETATMELDMEDIVLSPDDDAEF